MMYSLKRGILCVRKEFIDSRVVPVVSVFDDGYDRIRFIERRIGVCFFVPTVLPAALQ